MIVETLSTFPGMYDSVMGSSMMRIAQEKGIIEFRAHDLRDWTHDRHRTTDDDPYGGGAGLVMKCEPIFEAHDAIAARGPRPSGELASMVVIDAVVRKLPGVLGAATGALDESFSDGLLEHPQYTRPASFRGMEVPAVLLSGDHGAVARWRRERSLERTARLRSDLLEGAELSRADREFLQTLSKGASERP